MPRTPARRFLAPQARQGNGHGYVSQPHRPLPEASLHADTDVLREEAALVHTRTRMCDEPESPGPAIVDAITDLARTYDRLRYLADLEQRAGIRKQLTIEQRMADAQRRAKQRHADISGELHVIRQMLKRARDGGRKDPPAVHERLARIEARLDYRHDLADAA